MSKKLLWGILALIVLLVAVFLIRRQQPTETPATTATTAPSAQRITVTYENNAFNPPEVKIKVGDTVIFDNQHSVAIRVSSDPHPIHTSFPELESDTLEPGNTYQLTFTKPGTVNYHNHLNPKAGGKIIVE
ncbi:MAG: cupredoxin domain-containing protein [Candidatus Harrisonbacteria bacterium]|nr:cupredoxin domain-containing protein [Candidatus Harrisonbacteria bacterium]